MPKVALKPLNVPPSPDGYVYYDAVGFTPGSPPPRPGGPYPDNTLPGELPGGGGGGVITHPICLPGMPCWPEDPPTPPAVATVTPVPGDAGEAPTTPPPVGTKRALLTFPGEGYACEAWLLPYVSHHPKP